MVKTDALHGDSYQREIEGAVGEGGHEEGEWELVGEAQCSEWNAGMEC